VKCRTNTRSRWSNDARAIDARVQRAVRAVSAQRATPLDESGWLLFGYSQGALRAELLLSRYPERYVGGVLAGGPRAPKPGSLARVGRVVLMAGSHDVRGHLIRATEELTSEGVAAQFVMLPEARHGEYGPEAERAVGGALAWLIASASFTPEVQALQE
jgi:predicted esterase